MTTEIPFHSIAASAYRAYAASTGNKNFRGEPMPEFQNLPQPIQVAWEAAVRQAFSFLDVFTPHEESRWIGWLPEWAADQESGEAS